MNKFLIINLSPRKSGTSNMLCNILKDSLNAQIIELYASCNQWNTLLDAVSTSDTIVFVGPCYINTFPADTINLLEQMSQHPEILHGQKVYGIIQGGMPYVHTHVSGLNMLYLFCKEFGLRYCGGFVIGLGAMLNGQSLDKLPNAKKMKSAFAQFVKYIEKGERAPESLYQKAQMRIPSIVGRFLANYMNKRIIKELTKKGIDYRQPSPYLK